jgi:hypothetical protein
MRSIASLAGSLCLVITVVSGQAPNDRLRFVATDSADASRFLRNVAACAEQTTAFTELLLEISDSLSLSITVADHIAGVMFGSPGDRQSDAPLLSIDLTDVERLPTAAQVQIWSLTVAGPGRAARSSRISWRRASSTALAATTIDGVQGTRCIGSRVWARP